MQGTTLLTIDDLHKSYPGTGWLAWALRLGRASRDATEALRGVTLHVDSGELVGLLGPNGSGKSTLLRCACGLLLPTDGVVRVLGDDPGRITTHLRGDIGLVIRDDRSFNQRLTGRQNLEFFARLQGLARDERDRRIAEIAASLALTAIIDRPFRFFSSGMKQRLSVARALLGEPRLLLMDEATSGLDPGKRDSFYEMLTRLVDDRRIGVLYATHDLTEAQYLCSRVILLDEGRIAAEGNYLDVEPHAEAVFRREASEVEP